MSFQVREVGLAKAQSAQNERSRSVWKAGSVWYGIARSSDACSEIQGMRTEG